MLIIRAPLLRKLEGVIIVSAFLGPPSGNAFSGGVVQLQIRIRATHQRLTNVVEAMPRVSQQRLRAQARSIGLSPATASSIAR